MRYLPTVSIIINTDGRAKPLATCLDSLRYLRYPNFEVVVVAGPTRDGTHELCASWGDAIKFGECPVRNLSQSRNISIGLASGEIVAFLDDDSVPEPEWLDDVIPAFEDPEVAIAGGFLHDHTGKTYQWRFGTVDRFGTADENWERPAPEYNFPLSANIPHVMANSAFRRSALLEVGGFDEEYEYFLDETDVICRFVDAGWKVAQLDKGFIHHKFMPSHIRNTSRVLTSWYSLVKNKTYFSLRNGRHHASVQEVVGTMHAMIGKFREHVRWAIENGMLGETDAARFEDEAERGFRDGLGRGLNGARRLPPVEELRGDRTPFVVFPPKLPAAQQRCYVLLSRTYPPASLGGIGRYIHQLARTLAQRGHQVHVLTAGEGHDRVDFEENVWVHRIGAKNHAAPQDEALRGIPRHIWNHSRTMLDEAREIASRRRVDAVYAPIWDAEGVAFVGDPAFPLVTSLQTTMRFYLDSNPHLANDSAFMQDFAQPMLRVERLLLERSDGIHAISDAITREIEAAYGVAIDRSRLWMVPLGLEDWTQGVDAPAAARQEGVTRVCFIGRLESRKGVDVVMQAAPALLREHPGVRLEFVGNDRIPADDGVPWRRGFESRPEFAAIADRVVFHGEVGDAELREFYRGADIVLAPSRFESFGLVHLEAGMYGKPVIGCRAGGMTEVVDDGVTGLLAEPGDAASLLRALGRLVADAALREAMGRAARQRYLARFTPERMADGVAAMFDALASRRSPIAPARPTHAAAPAPVPPVRIRSAGEPLRIAMVASVLEPYDAIANDVARTAQFLAQTPGCEVTVFAGHNERQDIDARLVGRVSDLLLDPAFMDADVIVYHFGIYYPLFDALLLGNGHARQAVIFHNITPLDLVPAANRPAIEKSFAQLANLQRADAVWPVSRENLEMLLAHGVPRAKMAIQPLAVDRPGRGSIRKARGDAIQVLFIGRIVPAKGIQDLVEALALLGPDTPRVRVKVVGSLERAEPAFRQALLERIEALGLSQTIEFLGMIPDEARDRLYAQSHILAIPSYHEGFCVPVIEALRAGLVPVVYAAHNLRYVADGLCVPAPPGDVKAFAQAVASAVADVDAVLGGTETATLRLERGQLTAAEFDHSAAAHVARFEPEAVARSLRELVAALAAQARESMAAAA